jgi:hypothetical protein
MAGGSKKLRALVVTVLVVLALVVVADRVGNYVAERIAGDTIETSQHLSSRPDVSIDDLPFLTQFASGKYGQVTVTAHNVPVGPTSHQLDISQVRVVLHDVQVSHSFSSVRAAPAAATATISYADLTKALGIDVHYGGNGRVVAGDKISILGRTVNATISATPKLVNGALRFGTPVINGLGQLGGAVVNALDNAFDLRLPLSGIPFDVSVRSLQATSQGVEIQLSGANLSYSR